MASPAEPIKSLSDSGSNSSSDGSDSDSSSSSGSSSSSESEAEDNASEAAPSAARAVPDAKPVMSTSPEAAMPNRNAIRKAVADKEEFMPLGTRKRDRRSIEEIQRDISKKKGKASTFSSISKEPSSDARPHVVRRTVSPALQPIAEAGPIPLPTADLKAKGKPNSARARLTQKLAGRGGGGRGAAKPAPKAAKATSAVSIVTNISRPSKSTTTVTASSAPGGSPPPDADPADLLADARTNPKIVRTIHKALQRYGDLTDAPGCNEDPSTFCDELRQPNYIVRAKLCNSLKLPDDIIQTVSNEIVSLCHANLSEENVKFGDVDIKPAALIERLQENLKLRVAVQRALKKSGNPSQGAYGLASSRRDLVDLGIEQMPAWGYVEKECDWSPAKDRALLLGVYIHGVGYWEDILGDAKLAFEKHRVLTGTRLKGRAEDLLRKLPSPSGKPLATSSTSDSIRREHVAQQPTPSFGGKQLRVLPPAPVESEEEGEISADDETTSGANTIMPRYGGKNIRIMPPQKPTKVLLTSEQLVDKWDPKALLKDVKLTLKKVQKISSWGEDHSDDVLVEKVSKYLVEIGHVIDSLVCREDDMAMDELATCLWEYAATFTPFSALHFERLYDDMVADASHSRR